MGFIKDLYIDSFKDGFVGVTAGLVSWVVTIMTAFVVIVLVDSLFSYSSTQTVRVINKGYSPAHTTFIAQTVGKTTVMNPIHHSEYWYVKVDHDGSYADCKVSEDEFNLATVGSNAEALIGEGLITSSVYCNEIKL